MSEFDELIRVTKIFKFEMAHALHNYNGACKNIHGHSYVLSITIAGRVFHEENDPMDGLVIDFSTIKKIVTDRVVSCFDHALVLNKNTPGSIVAELKKHYDKILLAPFQPSCENLLLEIKSTLLKHFPEGSLYAVRLYETDTSYCEWNHNDNEKE